MFKFLLFLIALDAVAFSQSNLMDPAAFKGDHFVIYNTCKTAVLFCESTQQVYTFCGAHKNCQGLYVNPGDTSLLNYEDKAQIKAIVSDISFQGYFGTVLSHTFQPVINCMPPQPLQISIPLNAVQGSSFQINAESPIYDPPENALPIIPVSIYVYVGGQQPTGTTALSDFTTCATADTITTDVSVKEEFNKTKILLYLNPANGNVSIEGNYDRGQLSYIISDSFGNLVGKNTTDNKIVVDDIDNGVYFVTIYVDRNYTGTKRLIVLKQ